MKTFTLFFIRAQTVLLDLFIPLPLFTIEVAWFRGEVTSLIFDIYIEFAPSGFRVELSLAPMH